MEVGKKDNKRGRERKKIVIKHEIDESEIEIEI